MLATAASTLLPTKRPVLFASFTAIAKLALAAGGALLGMLLTGRLTASTWTILACMFAIPALGAVGCTGAMVVFCRAGNRWRFVRLDRGALL